MSTTYTWTINQMYTLQQPDPNYVVNVLWTLTGVDGTATGEINGNCIFDSDQESEFIPYDQLTEEQVIGWVQASLGEIGIANMKATVDGQIGSIINPPVSPRMTPLPWSA